MTDEAQILNVRIAHNRLGAHANRFAYSAFYLVLPLKTLTAARRLLFSVDRFNLFAFHARDHGDGGDPETWARETLHSHGVQGADGDVVLITLPRVLGYVFNPVSFWLCHDGEGRLRAVIAEVNNTVGGRHVYVCAHEDGRPIEARDRFVRRKAFYVSPFLDDEGEYTFRFDAQGGRVGVWIDFADANGPRLTTSIAGRTAPLTSARLLWGFARVPVVTVKVIALIHWQAVKLMAKGARRHAPPRTSSPASAGEGDHREAMVEGDHRKHRA